MTLFLAGGAARSRPRPGPVARRDPPRCAARRASARLPYAGASPPRRGCPAHRHRTEIRWRLAVPLGGRRTSRTGRVGPRHVRLPAAAAVCDGARSSNDYSSGRRTSARLETAAGFRSPRSTDVALRAFIRTAPGTGTPPVVTRFPVVCMAHRLRTAKTPRAQKFTSNQATCSQRNGDVIPFTLPLLSLPEGRSIVVMYRVDTSARHKGGLEPGTRAHRGTTGAEGGDDQPIQILEFAVLGLLREAPMHGYELRKRLNTSLGVFRAFSYGTLYPSSRRWSPTAG
ncbi:hypothetical protein SALBM217S_09534 [Streptomyces griseoloalbus]